MFFSADINAGQGLATVTSMSILLIVNKLFLCRECGSELSARARKDAVFCSSVCRMRNHRNPFPKELTEINRWIRYSKTKVPLTTWDECAKTNSPSTWSDYQAACSSTAGVGLGFVFNGDGYIGIDLDSAFSGGILKPWAQAILDKFSNTYAEISPSGNGIHIIARSEIFKGHRWQVSDGGVEIYSTGRFFTMTGKRFGNAPKKIKRYSEVVNPVLEIVESHR